MGLLNWLAGSSNGDAEVSSNLEDRATEAEYKTLVELIQSRDISITDEIQAFADEIRHAREQDEKGQ